MAFKINKPITSSQRQLIRLSTKHLRQKPLLKHKLIGLKKTGGRNNSGKITIHHKGGGHKKKYRKIDFNRKSDSEGIVCSLEYDPNRNAYIASVYNFVGHSYFYYILAPYGLNVGDIIKSGKKAEPKSGHSLPIAKIPVGSYIHNIVLKKKAQLS